MNISKFLFIASLVFFPSMSFAYLYYQPFYPDSIQGAVNTNVSIGSFVPTASTTGQYTAFIYGSTGGVGGLEIVDALDSNNVCSDAISDPLDAPFSDPFFYNSLVQDTSGLGCDFGGGKTYNVTLNRGVVGNQIATKGQSTSVFFLLTGTNDISGITQIFVQAPSFDLTPCNLIADFTNFDISSCFSVLLVPPVGIFETTFTDIKDTMLHKSPWGYVTRGVELLSTTSTSTLPALSVTLPDMDTNSPIDEMEMEFDPWQYFFVTGSPLNDTLVSRGADPKNVWEIFEDYYTWVVYFFLFVLIINRIIRLHHPHRNV